MNHADALAGYVSSYWQWVRYQERLRLSLIQSEILLELLHSPAPVELKQLADRLDRPIDQVRREVYDLARRQWVSITARESDRRQREVQLSEHGVRFLVAPWAQPGAPREGMLVSMG